MTRNNPRLWRLGRFRSLRGKLLFWFLTLSFIPLLILGVVAFLAAQEALTEQAFEQLRSVRVIKTHELENWLTGRRGDVLFARNLVVVRGTVGVNEGLPVLTYYKDQPDHPAYQEAFRRAEGVLGAFAQEIGGEEEPLYRDIMLIDLAGDVVFALDTRSVGTNIFETDEISPALFESGLEALYVGDIATNPVHADELHLRVAAPVLDDQGESIGLIVLETRVDQLNAIMTEREGLGESGETYLVGQDKLFRSESRFAPELGVKITSLNPRVSVDTAAVRSGLAGGEGTEVIDDYRGSPVLSSWHFVQVQAPTAVDSDGVRWVVLSEIDAAEVNEPVQWLAGISGLLGLIAVVVVIGVTTLVSRGVTTPITHVAEVAAGVAGGDLSRRAVVDSGDEIEAMAQAFNRMTDEIDRTLAEVSEQTRRLEIIAVLSGRLSAILEVEPLLAEMVELVKTRFDYYHAHVYLLDQAGQTLLLTAGAGQAGAQMKAKGHSINLSAPTSLVARAARSGQVIRIDDVRQAPDWLPNELLPDTQAEMAVPIVLEDQVVGVLDVQQDQVAGLDDSDASLLRSLANQVAVALRNARLFAEVEEGLNQARAAQERYLEQGWSVENRSRQLKPYLYQRDDVPALAEEMLAKIEQQALNQPATTWLEAAQYGAADNHSVLVSPLKLADEIIGVLQLHQAGSEASDSTWAEEDIAFMEAILDQAAQTAESLRLFDDIQERAGREQVIRDIADKLQAAPDLDSLLAVAARELGQRLPVQHTVVELGVETDPGPGNEPANGHKEISS